MEKYKNTLAREKSFKGKNRDLRRFLNRTKVTFNVDLPSTLCNDCSIHGTGLDCLVIQNHMDRSCHPNHVLNDGMDHRIIVKGFDEIFKVKE
ncbi:hypothetical protein KAR91_38740 [Candidatus Pacearchaeota archaeon]|nr:hypothetical protein [Candidatus Pacearchaeota archaeon]